MQRSRSGLTWLGWMLGLAVLLGGGTGWAANDESDAAADLTPSHKQIGTIKLTEGGRGTLNTFCLTQDGRIVTAWGNKTGDDRNPTQIRVFSGEGKLLTTWDVDIAPQMVNIGPDGTIFAAGYGKMIKLDPKTGEVLARGETPQAQEIRDNAEKIKDQYEQARKRQLKQYEQLVESAQKRIDKLEAKEELTASEKRLLASARRQKQLYEAQLNNQQKLTKDQAEQMLENKMAIRGIAVTDQDIFVSCYAAEGYGYDVWRMDHEFQQPKKIVSDLSGCCGNMDIQANNGELYVAENSRHRVRRFDRDGKLLASFGKADREGKSPDGFGSCCNPMNLRFGPNGEVYTSESNLGRIKRFTPDGKFLGVVGTVDLVPGCKHVAIAVGDNGDRVYMLDITRSQIIVMGRAEDQPEEKVGGKAPAEEPEAATVSSLIRRITGRLSSTEEN